MKLADYYNTSNISIEHKQVLLRSLVFSFTGFIFCVIGLIIDFYLGFYIVGICVLGLAVSLGACVWLCLKNRHHYFKIILLVFVNSLLLLVSYSEGQSSFAFVLFLPVILCMPFVLESKQKFHMQVFIYLLSSILCFVAAVFISPALSPWDNISAEVSRLLFYINTIFALIITVVFALIIIYSERIFKNVLYTEKTKAEEKNIIKNRFLSGTSHELRTALNGIAGAAYMLRQEKHLPQQEQHFDILSYCSDHMLNIVNEILDLEKIEAGRLELHPEICSLSKMIEEAPLPFYERMHEKKLLFRIKADERLKNLYVYADKVRMIQVMNNLLSNAVKFTEKGSIELKALLTYEDENNITIQITVIDTGIGIDEDDVANIFNSFWQVYNEKTLSERGTGLGLTISKNLLQLMQSDLVVSSKPGTGSSFSFTLKLKKAAKPVNGKVIARHQEPTLFINKKILVAEDDAINRMIAIKILELKKANVITAANGKEAVEMLSANKGIDVVLLDLEMPVMNGYEALIKMRERFPELPIIAFTAAVSDGQTEEHLKEKGFTSCIPKPFSPEIFYAKIYDSLKV